LRKKYGCIGRVAMVGRREETTVGRVERRLGLRRRRSGSDRMCLG
jgi:hypothetical protein